MTRLFRRTAIASAGLAAISSPGHAEFFDDTILAALEKGTLEISYDAPVASDGGLRWNNVSFYNKAERGGLSFDWIQEVPNANGAIITFSPDAAAIARDGAGNTTEVFDLKLNALEWIVALQNDGQSHDISFDGIAAAGDIEGTDGTFIGEFGSTSFQVSWTDGDKISGIYTAQSDGGSLNMRDMDSRGDALTLEAVNLTSRQTWELSRELFELIQSGEEPNPEDFGRLFNPVSDGNFAAEMFKISGTVINGPDGPGEFSIALADAQGTVTSDAAGEDMQFGAQIEFGGMDADVEFVPFNARSLVDGLSIGLNMGFDRDLFAAMAEIEEKGPANEAEIFGAMEFGYDIRLGDVKADGFADTPEGQITFDVVSEPSWETISLKDGVFRLEAQGGKVDARAMVPMVSNEEITYSGNGGQVKMQMPMLPSDELQEFQLKIALDQYQASEPIWALFDPQALIPRDPISLDIDIVALVEIMEALINDPEFEDAVRPETLTVNNFMIEGAGISVSGGGEADFVMTSGLPIGDGTFDFELKGVTGLMGTLAQLGIAPPPAVAGVNAVLGMFTKFEGPDHFSTKIELLPDGTAKANGVDIPIPR